MSKLNKTQKIVQQAHLEEEKRILRQLKLVYGQAQDDCINKIIDLSRRRDMENLQSVIYQKQYQEVLKKQLDGLLDNLQGEEFTSISEYLEKCYHNGYIGTMYDIHSQGIPIIMPINQEQVVQALQTDSKLSKSLYDSLGEDVNYLKRSIRAELSRGTANGSTWNEMAEKIAKGMNSPFKKAYNRAVVISRTEGHRIQQKSALDAQYAAKEKGADIVKQWDATLDNKTRPHHRRLDGQLRELEEPFELEGMTAMAPGYFGKPKEDCNCRCCLLQRARWALDEEELDELKKRATYFGLDKTKDFEAFKKKYMDSVESLYDFDIMKSGAVSGARNPYSDAANKHAERYYGLVRSMTTDVKKIAETTGYSEQEIQGIKNYIFIDEHDLGDQGVRQFDPDYMMGESWRRLIEGKPEQHDLTLIHHEILEKKLMQDGMSQEKAHIKASAKYNYDKEAREFYGKIKKFKKE
nr:MAG TPA: minor capsid protein [Caudoviricetes sp.]